ncbi:MAG TPA: chromate efflux transporter, partial [Gemmatimonadales bacterium]|nr:chromate efflux transporter [Gemmatimonadales bacterium]
WLTREEFLALNAAAQLIPGPNSTELAIHIGHRRGGWKGLVAAGAGFILPAAGLTLLVAWAYVRFGALPDVRAALAGVKLVVLVIVARALWGFGRTALTSPLLWALALAAAAATWAGINELLVLLLAGLVAWGVATNIRAAALLPALASIDPLTAYRSPLTLFASFAKIGAVLFGSGYVLYAFIHAEFVDRLGWLTTAQVTDAIAAGQITPGPLFSTATFVGYLVAGWKGALIATAGIFLPAFTFVALSAPLLPYLERHPGLKAARDGVVAASLGLLAATAVALGQDALHVSLFLAASVLIPATALVLRTKVSPIWLVTGGALLGVLLG